MKKVFAILFYIIPLFLSAQNWAINGIELNKSVKDTHVDSVWSGIHLPSGFTGEDIIIGITDWGFDYTHPVFYDTSMTHYRILRAWDQFKTSGPAPAGFDYGTEYIGREQLLSAQCDTFNIYKYGYHGTHVAGIAAGAGAGTPYRGVAHNANLLLATFLISEQAVVDAFDWMFSVAQEENKRLVINMSWGLYYMDNFTGTGKIGKKMEELSRQGVVFVTSAGNNGDENFHIKHNFSTETDTLKSVFLFSSGTPQYGQCITMTNSPNCSFSWAIQIMSNTYQTLQTSPFMHTHLGDQHIENYIIVNNDTIEYIADILASETESNRPEVRFKVKKPSSSYRLGLIVTAESGIFHAWNVIELTNGVGNWGASFIAPSSLQGWKSGDPYYGIGTPASTDCAISVAAYQPRMVSSTGTPYGGSIANFSSYGPTIDERAKPEIAGPGKSIISALSSFTTEFSGTVNKTITFQDRTYKFATLSGTSMSSPFVAGVVALMLEANPYLSANQIKQILQQTARQDSYTQQSTPTQVGAGKINAYQAVLLALQTVGVEEINTTQTQIKLFPNPSNGELYITAILQSNQPYIQIFDITGRKVYQQNIFAGVNYVSLPTINSGCYIIKIIDGQNVILKKWIKK